VGESVLHKKTLSLRMRNFETTKAQGERPSRQLDRDRAHNVSERKPFLLRIDRTLLDSVQRWANDALRSLNAQIEYLLRDSLMRTGRLPEAAPTDDEGT
jgi:hypothetical protein